MPLRALLNNADFYAWNLKEYDRNKEFRCPTCDGKFIVVIGTKKRRHFRHKSGRAHGEPESPEHLEMKEILYLLGKEYGNVSLEVSIDSEGLTHIVDVRLDSFAIECQCSNISIEEYCERNCVYLEKGLEPLWILGGEFFQNTRKFRMHKRVRRKTYRIQRIRNLEKRILGDFGVLYYYKKGNFYKGEFKLRSRSKTLGWYNLQVIAFNDILEIELNSTKRKELSLTDMQS